MDRCPELATKITKILLVLFFGALISPNITSGLASNSSFFAPPTHQAQNTEKEDPFYRKLYDEGKYFYDKKNFAGAIQDFEIASFGYLDNLPRLLECYVYLTICQFQQRNYEKAKFWIDEIKRLNLED
jgi:outer membrane protein assembly factor BamD (BamD/ComL family)